MDEKFLGVLVSGMKGSAGDLSCRMVHGRRVFAKKRRPRLSMTAAATGLRRLYVAVERCWNMQVPSVREAWLRGCRVPKLSGRDLWGRVNWHQIGLYDSFLQLPPTSQPRRAPKIKLAGVIPTPQEVRDILGGSLHTVYQPLICDTLEARAETGTGPTVPAAISAAYTAVQAAAWLPSPAAQPGWHLLQWWPGPPCMAFVQQLRSRVTSPGLGLCAVTSLLLDGDFSWPPSRTSSGGIELAGTLLPEAQPSNQVAVAAGSPLYAAGQWQLGDGGAWGALALAAGPGDYAGWALAALNLVAEGRG